MPPSRCEGGCCRVCTELGVTSRTTVGDSASSGKPRTFIKLSQHAEVTLLYTSVNKLLQITQLHFYTCRSYFTIHFS